MLVVVETISEGGWVMGGVGRERFRFVQLDEPVTFVTVALVTAASHVARRCLSTILQTVCIRRTKLNNTIENV